MTTRVDCLQCGWTVPVGPAGPEAALREHWALDHVPVAQCCGHDPHEPGDCGWEGAETNGIEVHELECRCGGEDEE